jgi:hypothetical protein
MGPDSGRTRGHPIISCLLDVRALRYSVEPKRTSNCCTAAPLHSSLAERINRMSRRPWINKYGTVAVLLMLLLVMNPELRAFLLLANFIGVDLVMFFIVIQLQNLLLAMPSTLNPMRTFLCVAGYGALRVTTRIVALLLAPARVSGDLATLLFVLSKNMWCPKLKQDFQQI